MIGAIILQIVLIFLNGIFAGAEIAVISLNETKLQKMAEGGNKRAARLQKLTREPAKFLSTIQVAITLAGFLGSAFAADNFSKPLTALIMSTGINVSEKVIGSLCLVLITVLLAYFNIVFGELIPKRLAMQKTEKTALAMSGTLRFVSVVFAPIVWLLTVSTNGVLWLLGIKSSETENEVTGEEIMMMAEAGSENGSIDASENEFIKNVFEFKQLSVGEVCTHRKETDILYLTKSDEDWERMINETFHTCYPVCGSGIDDVKGVLYTKDYFRLKDKTRLNVLKKAVAPAVFVAENTPANTLFYKMRDSREYFAIVVDEYGGMRGIITLHDLVEELVGELTAKDDDEEYSIKKIKDGEWEIIGPAPIDKVLEQTETKIPEEASEEFETFGGYVCSVLGEMPEDGSTFTVETDGLTVRVTNVSGRCINKMIVSRNVSDAGQE